MLSTSVVVVAMTPASFVTARVYPPRSPANLVPQSAVLTTLSLPSSLVGEVMPESDEARFAAQVLDMDGVEFRQTGVYDVAALGERFDLVIFMGVFYHLRHPLLALDLIREHVAEIVPRGVV